MRFVICLKPLTATNTTFDNNTALGGSAIYYDCGTAGGATTLKIVGCTFTNNASSAATKAATLEETLKQSNLNYIDDKDDFSSDYDAGSVLGENTFSGNTTHSDINLAPKIGTTQTKATAISMSGFALSKTGDSAIDMPPHGHPEIITDFFLWPANPLIISINIYLEKSGMMIRSFCRIRAE